MLTALQGRLGRIEDGGRGYSFQLVESTLKLIYEESRSKYGERAVFLSVHAPLLSTLWWHTCHFGFVDNNIDNFGAKNRRSVSVQSVLWLYPIHTSNHSCQKQIWNCMFAYDGLFVSI